MMLRSIHARNLTIRSCTMGWARNRVVMAALRGPEWNRIRSSDGYFRACFVNSVQLRERFMSADSPAEESEVFDVAMAVLDRLEKSLLARGKRPDGPPLDIADLRQRYRKAVVPIDQAIAFDHVIAAIERCERLVQPEAGTPSRRRPSDDPLEDVLGPEPEPADLPPDAAGIGSMGKEQLKARLLTALRERDTYRQKLEQALGDHAKMKQLLERLSKERLELMMQSRGNGDESAALQAELARTLDLSNEQRVRYMEERETLKRELDNLKAEHDRSRRQLELAQKERDQQKSKAQVLLDELQQLRATLEKMSGESGATREEHDKLLDENFKLKTGMFRLAMEQLSNLESKVARLQKPATKQIAQGRKDGER